MHQTIDLHSQTKNPNTIFPIIWATQRNVEFLTIHLARLVQGDFFRKENPSWMPEQIFGHQI